MKCRMCNAGGKTSLQQQGVADGIRMQAVIMVFVLWITLAVAVNVNRAVVINSGRCFFLFNDTVCFEEKCVGINSIMLTVLDISHRHEIK